MMAALKGTTNLCKALTPPEYSTSIATRFLLADEHPLFILQSVADDYLFSNLALVHLDGCGPVGKKRSARRSAWKDHILSNVTLDTAGVADNDVEVKFYLRARDGSGAREYSIDVKKDQVTQATNLYKALVSIAEAQAEGVRSDARLRLALSTVAATGSVAASADPLALFRAIASDLHAAELHHAPHDVSPFFARYVSFEGGGAPLPPPRGPPPPP